MKYTLTLTHRYEIETDNLREVLDNYEFPTFPVGVIGEPEFLDGTDTYEPVETTTPCDVCGTPVDTDIHKEELGMCLGCSNDYFTHADEEE